MRTIVELPDNQLNGLSHFCRREKISRAEAVRRAVDRLLDEQKPNNDGIAAAFGLWKGRRLNSRRYVEQLRERMGMKALFDSDVLIDLLLGETKARDELRKYTQRLISIVSWAEVMMGARTDEEKRRCRDFLSSFDVIPFDRPIAEEAVRLRQSRNIKLPDAIIWATARTSDALLVTRNSKDFPKNDPFVRFPYVI